MEERTTICEKFIGNVNPEVRYLIFFSEIAFFLCTIIFLHCQNSIFPHFSCMPTVMDAEQLQEEDLLATSSNDSDSPTSEPTGALGDEEGTLQSTILSTGECSEQSPEGDENDICLTLLNAKSHLQRHMANCSCTQSCSSHPWIETALGFARLSEHERTNYVRAILFATTAMPGQVNELSEHVQVAKRRKLKPSSEIDEPPDRRVTTKYALNGRRLCHNGFAAIVQMSPQVVSRHASSVGKSNFFTVIEHASLRRKGKPSLQTVVSLMFLERHAEVYALACPTGRGSDKDAPIRYFPSDKRRAAVHDEYKKQWSDLIPAASEHINFKGYDPEEPLNYKSFCKVWHTNFPTLKIMKIGSDFCDTCTKLKNQIEHSTSDLKDALSNALNIHRKIAKEEFLNYRKVQNSIRDRPSDGTIHIIIDFAEKVLLPHMLKQPGQLHFITGLKFDFFCVSNTNLNTNFIFGLPEGHWPSGKSANDVASMIEHVLRLNEDNEVTKGARKLVIHADNCAGQNKNKYNLWYLAWRLILRLHDEIVYNFLIAGHTKNSCDGAFGLVKMQLKRKNVYTPRDMMRTIDESTSSNSVVCSKSVMWIDWKEFLGKFFTVPKGLHVSKEHVFRFRKEELGIVSVKHFSSSPTFQSFNLFKRGVSAENVIAETVTVFSERLAVSKWPKLEDVPSTHDGNRRAYLVKNVLDRYFVGDEALRKDYFASGVDWKNN